VTPGQDAAAAVDAADAVHDDLLTVAACSTQSHAHVSVINHPHRARSAKLCTRQALQFFYALQYFGAQGDPLSQSSPILAAKVPSIDLQNFVPF